MRHPRVFELLPIVVGTLCCAAVARAAQTPPLRGLGFASALGAGAAVAVDPAAALFENPARLAHLGRSSMWAGTSGGSHQSLARFAVSTPLLRGTALGLAYSGGDALANAARRDVVHLGAAHALASGLSYGAALTLQAQTEADAVRTSFGLDFGLDWQMLQDIEVGVAVANAVRPRFNANDVDARELRGAATWTHAFAATWSAGLNAGLRASPSHRRELAASALFRHDRLELALGLHDGAMRAGGAVHTRAWRLAYAYGDGGAHEIGVQVDFGPTPNARRLHSDRANELAIAGRVALETARLDAARLADWTASADTCLGRGRFEQAATLFAALVALQPDSPRAREGLRRARHGSWVEIADSLRARHDAVGETLALEQALRFAPEDSTRQQRLQALRTAAAASQSQDVAARRFDAGVQAFAQQRYADAARAFEEVLRLEPQHPQAESSLQQAKSAHVLAQRSALRTARQRLNAGDLVAARTQVRRVLETEPRHGEALKILAQIEKTERKLRADAAPKNAPSPTRTEDAAPVALEVAARYDEGMQLYRASDLVGAMQAWEEVERAAPQYQEVARNLVRVYRVTGLESYTEGRLHEAVESWQKALRLEPDNVQVRRYLNQAHAKLARTPSAEPPGH